MSKAKLTPTQRVNRLRRKVSRFYGPEANNAPIRLGKTVVEDTFGTTSYEPTTIHLSRNTTKKLVSRNPYKRRMSRGVVLHEMAHADGDRTEEGADRKAAQVSRALNKQQARRLKAKRSNRPQVIDHNLRKAITLSDPGRVDDHKANVVSRKLNNDQARRQALTWLAGKRKR